MAEADLEANAEGPNLADKFDDSAEHRPTVF